MHRIVKISVFAALFLLTTSCSTTLNPKDFDIGDVAAPNLINIKPLAVKAKIIGTKATEIPLPGNSSAIVNEDEFTQVLAERVTDALKRNNVTIASGAERSIEVQVVKVSLQPTNTMYCVIDFNRKLGREEFYGFQSRSKHWNFITACEEALNNAVNDLLTEQNTLRYLKGE